MKLKRLSRLELPKLLLKEKPGLKSKKDSDLKERLQLKLPDSKEKKEMLR